MGIQLLLIFTVLCIGFFGLRALRGEKQLAMKRLLALFAAACAIIAILFPQVLTKIAHSVGIGRGTDLLLYLSIVAGMVIVVAITRAKARTDARVTELARAVALIEARQQYPLGQPGEDTEV